MANSSKNNKSRGGGGKNNTNLQEFKNWLNNLTWNDLESALEICIKDEAEVKLMNQVIQGQVGPPTPIHPRAAKWASLDGVADGRFATEQERRTWNRIHRPRLLKLQPKVTPSSFFPQSTIQRKRRNNKGKNSGTASTLVTQQYDVMGKAFVGLTRDGTQWGVPPLKRLRRADLELMERTVLCAALDGTETVVLRFQQAQKWSQPKQVYNLLRTASRGNFLTQEQKADAMFPNWLQPTTHWFSLGKFLAARFEMALVQSFARQRAEQAAIESLWYQPMLAKRITNVFHSEQEVWSVVKKLLQNSVLSSDGQTVPNVRDCLIHALLLEQPMMFQSGKELFNVSEWDSSLTLYTCPLFQWGSVSQQCRALVRQEVNQLVATKIEQELLFDSDNTAKTNNSQKDQASPKAKIGSAKKKRSKKRNKNRQSKTKQQYPTSPPRHTLSRLEEETSSDCEKELLPPSPDPSSKSSEDAATQQASNHSVEYPGTSLTISDGIRNQNSAIQEVGLADKVGETTEQNESDEGGWVDLKTFKKQLQKPKPVPVRSDPAVRRTAPVPNAKKKSTKGKETEGTEEKKKVLNKGKETERSEEKVQPLPALSSAAWPDLSQQNNATEEELPGSSPPQRATAYFDESQVSAAMGNSPMENPGNLTTSTRGAFDIFASPYGNLAGGFFLRSPEKSIDFAWDTHDFAFDQWGLGGSARERSIMDDLFLSLERREQEAEENIMASSTIASIASSTNDEAYIENSDDPVDEELTENNEREPDFPGVEEEKQFGANVDGPATPEKSSSSNSPQHASSSPKTHGLTETPKNDETHHLTPVIDSNKAPRHERSPSPQAPSTPSPTLSPILVSLADLQEMRKSGSSLELKDGSSSDLQDLAIRKTDSSDSNSNANEVRSFSSVPATANVRSSPHVVPPRMVTSLSRENLRGETDAASSINPRTLSNPQPEAVETAARLKQQPPPLRRSSSAIKYSSPKARDDNDIKNRAAARRRSDALESYRTVASRSLVKSRDDNDVIRNARPTPPRMGSYRAVASKRTDSKQSNILFGNNAASPDIPSAKSEVGNEDFAQNWQDGRRSSLEEADNNTATRDGSTTITSALSQQKESEETLREERDTYRDLCLTLGAEVAKLKNLLASQNHLLMSPQTLEFSHQHPQSMMMHGPTNFFDHPASFHHLAQNARGPKTLTAMSDAEFRVEHESMQSMASEDELAAGAMVSHQRHVSSGATATSDASVEHSAQHQQLNFTVGIPTNQSHRNELPATGVQSRLSIDIMHFVDMINNQLRKQGTRRMKAAERMTRLVTTLWPRAQCKLYGSHVTGLSLPTSDVDFVICLPAVQKDTPAVAPGVLEGRNAINETSQKMLSRKLKNESWIDPRSMKLIERTVVPVIKVATKDTKAKTLQLDITFDAPSHHGLEAVELVNHLLDEYPMIRPLVLVLKKFLLDRGLLTGYTGGLSSYCLFLMTARYLQEQAASWADCGALLMGFLDFYGNHFDPRTTGISVRLCQYFARPNYAANNVPPQPPQMMWNPATPAAAHPNFAAKGVETNDGQFPEKSYVRRNSFSDKGSVDGLRGATTGAPSATTSHRNGSGNLPPFQPAPPMPTAAAAAAPNSNNSNHFETTQDHGMPYTFDPLFVEDPLAMGNNVGRNTFRIFQVLRAFSDAHRALVASLEWDLQSSGDLEDLTEYPLLKCLLQSEDVVFDL